LCSRKDEEKHEENKRRNKKRQKRERKNRIKIQESRRGDKNKEKKETNQRPACLFTNSEQFNFVVSFAEAFQTSQVTESRSSLHFA
jgi:hypothetical protein